jgi:hypothetical protein
VAVAAASHVVFIDYTGITAGIAAATLGLLIIPARKRKAKKEYAEKLAELRTTLMDSLTSQFEREMQRSTRRLEDIIAPFTRFVRAEEEKILEQQKRLSEVESQIAGLQSILDDEAA